MIWSLYARDDPDQMRRLVVYFILYWAIFENIYNFKVAKIIAENINTGMLNYYLVKPIEFVFSENLKSLSRFFARMIIPIIGIIIGIIVVPGFLAPENFGGFIYSMIFSFLGFLLWKMIDSIVGLLSVWIVEVANLCTVIDLTFVFFSGGIMPAYLFPDWLDNFLRFTPIFYFISFPINLWQGFYENSEVLWGLLVMFLWGILFLIILLILKKKAILSYEAYG